MGAHSSKEKLSRSYSERYIHSQMIERERFGSFGKRTKGLTKGKIRERKRWGQRGSPITGEWLAMGVDGLDWIGLMWATHTMRWSQEKKPQPKAKQNCCISCENDLWLWRSSHASHRNRLGKLFGHFWFYEIYYLYETNNNNADDIILYVLIIKESTKMQLKFDLFSGNF